MLALAWKDEATAQFEAIIEYIAQRNYDAAARLDALIGERVQTLRAFPYLGRPGRLEDTRELVPHPNFIVVYRIEPKTIRVLAILHARRQYP